jgi:hypothetical protein
VPHFVEGLGNVKECSGAVLLGFEGCLDLLDDTVGLVDGKIGKVMLNIHEKRIVRNAE